MDTDTTDSRPLSPAGAVGHGVLAIYNDLVCPWATVVIERLHTTRDRLGIDVVFDLRPFPLELVNDGAAPLDVVNRSVRAARRLAPDYGFAEFDQAPGSSLLGLEAVRASYQQSPAAADALDRALRRALFVDHADISDRDVVLDVAARTDGIDSPALAACLDTGRFAADVREHADDAEVLGVQGSPHVFLSDGRDEFLPSLEIDADGDEITVTRDDPDAIEDLLIEAARTRQSD